jgi:hypothetical protein
MDAENWSVIVVVSPFALQLTGVADVIVTAAGPVTVKSDPLTATEEHKIGSAKVNVMAEGIHVGGSTVPIGIFG